MIKIILIICAIYFSALAKADRLTWQGYDIHYTSFNSMLIPKELAAAHDIVRSKHRIVTNISIRKNNKAVKAHIAGNAKNLLGQLLSMHFDEVIEPGAIYYLSNQLIDERDTIRFSIELIPLGSNPEQSNPEELGPEKPKSYLLEFTRQYH